MTGAAGLPENRDVARVAAELRDVVADPFERLNQIEHAHVPGLGVPLAADLRQIQESKHVQAMVHRDEYRVVHARQALAVVRPEFLA
jgi:hypothetical protein